MAKDVSHQQDDALSEDAADRLLVKAGQERGPRSEALRDLERQARDSRMDDYLRELVDRQDIDIAALVERARREHRDRRWRTLRRRTALAAMLAVIAAGSLLLLQDRAVIYASANVPKLFTLGDGSQVELNTHSEIKVRLSEDARDVYLKDGEGLFNVHPDKHRPFRVHAREAMFEALGTQFAVRLDQDQAAVAVVDGIVQFRPASAVSATADAATGTGPRLTAGLSLTVDRAGRAGTPRPINVIEATAWRRHQPLVFSNISLGEIADAINGHSEGKKLIIQGEALRARRYGLSLKASSVQELVSSLEEYEDLSCIEAGDRIIVRERSP